MHNPLLCSHVLPGPRLCTQPHLRGERFCRFHMPDQAEEEHDARMYSLNDQLEAMDLPQLLTTLRQKLDKIACYLRPYPEAKLALIVTIDRLNWLEQADRRSGAQTLQNEQAQVASSEIHALFGNRKESTT